MESTAQAPDVRRIERLVAEMAMTFNWISLYQAGHPSLAGRVEKLHRNLAERRDRGAVRPPSARRRQGQDPLPERVPRQQQQPRPQLHLRALPAAGRHPRLLQRGHTAGTPRFLPLPPAAPRGKRGGEARRDPEGRGCAGDRGLPVQLQGGSLAKDPPPGRGGTILQPGGRALADDPHGERVLRGRRRGSSRRISRSLPR